MVLEEGLQSGGVALQAREGTGGCLDRTGVGREEREPMELRVQDVEESSGAGLIGGQLNRFQRGIDARERDIVGGNGHREGLRNIEDVVDNIDGDVSNGSGVGHDRIVPVGQVEPKAGSDGSEKVPLVQNVYFSVRADGPCDCLVLVALELSQSRVVQERTSNGGVRISCRYSGEVALYHMVCDDVGEEINIGGNVRRCAADYGLI